MRKFFSYGPVYPALHYYAPRTALIDSVYNQLIGDDPSQGGHYITVWAPRQTGKTWVMQEVLFCLRKEADFHVAKLNLQDLEDQDAEGILRSLAHKLGNEINRDLPVPESQAEFAELFTAKHLDKPLILILDEFDSLPSDGIRTVVSAFRNLYIHRREQSVELTHEKKYLLHSVALIGVRSVLGIGDQSGSPFNVQRSVHIPNLTKAEVRQMYGDYERESGQMVETAVVDRIFDETRGQPGLVSWLGELLTETYNKQNPTIDINDFESAYSPAIEALPNNNIINIISKANREEYKPLVLELFRSEAKLLFHYDDPETNFLYMNGVVDQEVSESDQKRYLKFPSPFVQKRLFNYFAHQLFWMQGRLYEPLDDLTDTITETEIFIPRLMQRYESYVQKNKSWLFKEAPRRLGDERLYEAVYHFNLYSYLEQFLQSYGGTIYPEFPTGNGKVDLFIRYAGKRYGIELKSFTNRLEYTKALTQAAKYGHQLGHEQMWLVFFIDSIDDDNRRLFETTYVDESTSVTVQPLVVVVG